MSENKKKWAKEILDKWTYGKRKKDINYTQVGFEIERIADESTTDL